MGNKQAGPEVYAAKFHIEVEEAQHLLEAFGKKKAVRMKKFKAILDKVHKERHNATFAPDMVEVIFNILDADHNHKVDVEEFICGVSVLVAGDTEARAKLIFNAIDKDKSGKISKAEFRVYLSKMINAAKKIERAREIEERIPLPERLINRAAVFASEAGIIDSWTDETFKSSDTDHDNEISLEEWLTAAKSGAISQKLLEPGELVMDHVEKFQDKLKEF